jgi:hypothetical protein
LLLAAGVFTYSAARGFSDMDACKAALDQFERDSARAPSAPQAARDVSKNVPGTVAE